MLDSRDIGGLQGAPVIGQDNDKLGTVGQVFLDATTGAPNWVTVKSGLFGHKETFVPLANATWNREEIHVDIDRETFKEAPRIDADEALTPHNEEALYRYYGMSDTDTDGGTARPDEYPEREYATSENGAVTPVPVGMAAADRARTTDASRDDDADLDRADREDWDDSRRADGTHTDADRPRNLDELHPAEADLRRDGDEPRDLRLSEQPLGDSPAADGAHTGERTGKHARLRRYDPATDAPTTGEPTIDRTDPPRNL